MPSHIYYRVGRYEDAARANELAAAADESYIAQCRAQGYYPAGYYPHNLHFLWAASSLEGRSEVALAAARRLATAAPDEQFEAYPMMEDFRPTYHFTLVRFGRWQQILEESAPPSSLHYSTAMWHYARGMALAHLDRRREAAEELSDLFVIARSKDMQELVMWSGAPAKTLLGIAVDVLAAELAWQASDYDEAIARLRAGVEKQDSFAYTEPPPWYFPVRQALGAALLESGRPAEAEAVYREDLAKHPRNGWSLYGLAASLRAQGKADAAATVTARFDQAWRRADVALDRSYF
jgi:tetratricopeptide (TPR) repeat protein